MKRFISILCVCCTLFSSVSEAYITKEMEFEKEVTIPFSFSSNKAKVDELISLAEYENVKLIDSYVDNGTIETNLLESFVEIELNEGEYVKGY